MPESSSTTVGFIGLGNMGLPMATRLVENGFTVQAFDTSTAPLARLEQAGGVRGESAPEAVRGAHLVVLMLPSSAIVTNLVHDQAFLERLEPGALLIDMGSSEPAVNTELAAFLAGRDVRMIDAPVSGGVRGAQNGSLTIMAGGAPGDIEEASELLSVLGRVAPTGGIGSGDAVKALNNLLSATHLWVTGEVMAAGARFGLDPEVMLSVFNSSSGRSGSTEAKWPKFVLPETFDSGFGLRLMLKDMRIAVHLCQQMGLPARLGEFSTQIWAQAAEDLAPDADHTEVARWLSEPHPGERVSGEVSA